MTSLMFALGVLPLGLTIAMFASKNSMLGFPCGIFWGILGGYAYSESIATWDTHYFLFFASMGMVIFTIFAAFALRKRDLDEPAEDEGGYIDESPRSPRSPTRVIRATLFSADGSPCGSPNSSRGRSRDGSWGDIDRLGMHDLTDNATSNERSKALRERAAQRRLRDAARKGKF